MFPAYSGATAKNAAPPLASGRRWGGLFERACDVLLAGAALLIVLPAMAFIFVLIRLSDGGPAIYRQRRVGRGGRPFGCLKFRTMVLDADERLAHLLETDAEARTEWEATCKLRRDPRITVVGQVLRKLSLDELPQLFNVLRGDMALVGPRPIIEAEIGRYGRYFPYYTSVRPGLTGLWQVSGRSSTSYRRRVACDYLYVRRRSFELKLRILLCTVPAVLLGAGSA